ncbi:MAG: aryl-sulfate sulfotransferase [Bacteroidetes bacterium]|nr:aryl-sulfate sulfotransferase [Bacteroidota bacterium]
MKIFTPFIIITIFFNQSILFAQQTVGLFLNTEEAYNGYTLFAPFPSQTTYLINNCGEMVHSWTSSTRSANSVYLLENGNLLKTKKLTNSIFNAGGSGGGLEVLDWNGNVLWDYDISSSTECHHHDVAPLPNGNFLAIVWDGRSKAEAIQAGRDSIGDMLWGEKIIEIKPDYTNGGGEIVWEWNTWDHMVQDHDNSKDNFGNVSQSPELIDINYYPNGPNDPDWLHFNGFAYNEELDQIILSCHAFSEIWIIDHSTTTSQAAGHSGGNSGKGGDLLFRWGNPQAYRKGSATDQKLFRQHNPYWIQKGYTDEGMIMVFNNQAGTGNPQNYSTVNIINPSIKNNGDYDYDGNFYLPQTFHWTYQAPVPADFFASFVSGAQRLPNGNTVICNGPIGKVFEIDSAETIVWEYVNPVDGTGIVPQNSAPSGNLLFRATRYTPDYPGLAGKDLTPQGYIESGSTFSCEIFSTSTDKILSDIEMMVYPNPTSDKISIDLTEVIRIDGIEVFDFSGRLVWEKKEKSTNFTQNLQINLSSYQNGMYLIRLTSNGKSLVKQVLKQ